MLGNAYYGDRNPTPATTAAALLQEQRIPPTLPALEQQETISIDDDEILNPDSDSDESPGAPVHRGGGGRIEAFARCGFSPLPKDTVHHSTITKCFLDGLGQARAAGVTVTAVHRNSISVPSAKARFFSFRVHEKAVAERCGGAGNGNARYAWYGGSRDEIRQILNFGFSRCTGGGGHALGGVGVHLSAISFPTDCLSLHSLESAAADQDGTKHLLLCRVLLGKVERVPAGSSQSAPSSVAYDTGVDDLTKPRRYVVWSSFMNSHIFPAFVVSFKDPSNNVNGLNSDTPVSSSMRPRSPWMSFPALLSVLSGILDPRIMSLVSKSFVDFQRHRINREQMIRRTRQLVGDELLSSVIKTHQKELTRGVARRA
ncbi:unnamed protein product [Linum tenue]|uniref:Inactive poly [ADP-ribose] polymerase SRO2 n=1 Tax=Linum tenue TaxID=586396 RepID=A0AAV0LJM2_9ROSI|nr:unnamed protein product [Linum tenue]